MLWVGYRTCRAEELPLSDQWLAPAERETLARLKIEKRRSDFRIGRFAAKRGLAAAWVHTTHAKPAPALHVIAADDGAPEARFEDGRAAPFSISISHSHGHAVCAVAPSDQHPELRLGCDLELVEPRSEELIRQFFTLDEQRRVHAAALHEMPLVATLIWSAKESALKALRSGLRADTRSVEVGWPRERTASEWQPLWAETEDGARKLTGHFRTLLAEHPENSPRTWVLTLLSAPECAEPVRLSDQSLDDCIGTEGRLLRGRR